jgi:hypothetical protein
MNKTGFTFKSRQSRPNQSNFKNSSTNTDNSVLTYVSQNFQLWRPITIAAIKARFPTIGTALETGNPPEWSLPDDGEDDEETEEPIKPELLPRECYAIAEDYSAAAIQYGQQMASYRVAIRQFNKEKEKNREKRHQRKLIRDEQLKILVRKKDS